jgi:hypothetical protein
MRQGCDFDVITLVTLPLDLLFQVSVFHKIEDNLRVVDVL